MPFVFRQISEAFIRIEEDVFVPAVRDTVNINRAPLTSNHLVQGSANTTTRTERNQRRIFVCRGMERLQNLQPGILRIENGVTAVANDRDRVAKGAQGQCGSAAGAIK